MARVRDAHARDLRDLRRYVFERERTVDETDAEGRRSVRRYRYRVVPREGWDEEVLLQVNGRPPAPNQLEWMERKNEKRRKAAGRGKRVETERPSAGGTDAHEWGAEAQRGVEGTLVGLLGVMDARLAGDGEIGGRPAWRLEFLPRGEERGGNEVEKVASRCSGTAWVDRAGHHLLRVDARLARPVRLRGGLVRVREFEFTFENQQVPGGMWFPREIGYSWDARAGFRRVRMRTVDRFSRFQLASTSVETEFVLPGETPAPGSP